METRYATHPTQVPTFDTEALRDHYLVETLFVADETKMYYSHEDRMIIGGVYPVSQSLPLQGGDQLRSAFFLERREIGIINIGGTGAVKVGDVEYVLERRDCLYIGLGNEHVTFSSVDQAQPAKFYFISTPAHKTYPTQKASIAEATPAHLGSASQSNTRTIYKYIHDDGIQSCQLVMGMTILEPNNMWNSMPTHTHDRRSEVYLYFDLAEDARVFHFMGQPTQTRHLVMANEQAVISPAWSIHTGVGTSNYTFIWAMGGENKTFADMDQVTMDQLR